MVPDGIILYKCSSSVNSVLRHPFVRTVSYGERYFAYFAPSTCNFVSEHVRSLDSVSTFKSHTKIHIFRLSYQLFNLLILILGPLSVVFSISWVFCQCFVIVTMFCNNVL